MIAAGLITTVTGRFWRSTFAGQEHRLLDPAEAPNGRWHHGGQSALYLSASPQGCRVALRVYLVPGEPERRIYPITVSGARVVDLRRAETRGALGTTLTDIHAFWADHLKAGRHSPTWEVSDLLRQQAVHGVLSPSRSCPELTHLTLFRWNTGGAPKLKQEGEPLPFHDNQP